MIGRIDLDRLIFLDESGVSTQRRACMRVAQAVRGFMKLPPMADGKFSPFWAPSAPAA